MKTRTNTDYRRRVHSVMMLLTGMCAFTGVLSWLLCIRPVITSLEQARPFQLGQSVQVQLDGDHWYRRRWYGIWSDYPGVVMGMTAVKCQVAGPDGRSLAVPLFFVGENADAWNSVLWWAGPDTPNARKWGSGYNYRPIWRFRAPVSGVYTITCAPKGTKEATVYDWAWFAVGPDVSAHASQYISYRGSGMFSGWGVPISFAIGVVGTPTCIFIWSFMLLSAKRRFAT